MSPSRVRDNAPPIDDNACEEGVQSLQDSVCTVRQASCCWIKLALSALLASRLTTSLRRLNRRCVFFRREENVGDVCQIKRTPTLFDTDTRVRARRHKLRESWEARNHCWAKPQA